MQNNIFPEVALFEETKEPIDITLETKPEKKALISKKGAGK